jgi:hypothetical protein
MLERLRSNSGVTPEQLRMNGKPLRRSKGWIYPLCSLKSKRCWNVEWHIRRQHSESRLEPLDALTMETRDEKYRKHIVEKRGKLVQNISKRFGPSPYTVISTNPLAFNYTLLDIRNTPSYWPYFAYTNLYHSEGTDILDSIEEFKNYLAYNPQEFTNLTWKPAYKPFAFSNRRAMVHKNPLWLTFVAPNSIAPLQSLGNILWIVLDGTTLFTLWLRWRRLVTRNLLAGIIQQQTTDWYGVIECTLATFASPQTILPLSLNITRWRPNMLRILYHRFGEVQSRIQEIMCATRDITEK